MAVIPKRSISEDRRKTSSGYASRRGRSRQFFQLIASKEIRITRNSKRTKLIVERWQQPHTTHEWNNRWHDDARTLDAHRRGSRARATASEERSRL